jgi:hypothetical protein
MVCYCGDLLNGITTFNENEKVTKRWTCNSFSTCNCFKKTLQFEQNILMSLNFLLRNINLSKLCWLGLMAMTSQQLHEGWHEH